MWTGLSAILAAGIIGGTSPILLKVALKELPPLLITLFRFIIASFILLPFFLNWSKDKLSSKNIKALVGVSLFFSLNVSLFSIAIQYTTAIISQILYLAVPIIVIILSYYVLGERLTRYKILGLILSVTGVLFLISQSIREQDVLTFGTPFGNILTILASFSWAFYLVLSKKLTKVYSPITTSFASYIVTFFLLMFLVPFEYTVRPVMFENITLVGFLSVLALGIVNTALMFFLVQFSIQKTSSFAASFSLYIGPLAAAAFAVPLFGEKVTLELLAGGILMILGVFFATTYEQVKLNKKAMLQ